MRIKVDNASFKNRNRGKVKTLVGSDEVFLDLLDLKYLVDDEEVSLREILESIYTNKEILDKRIDELNAMIGSLKQNSNELKDALKQYIEQEKQIDIANTSSIELLSTELAKINMNLNELNAKCKFL